jgi:hypothetical protein
MLVVSLFLLCFCGVHTISSKPDEVMKEEQHELVTDTPSNILFFHFMGSTSHLHFMRPLAERLAEVGHNVTFVQYAQSKFQHKNFREILIEDKLVTLYFVNNANKILNVIFTLLSI